MMATRNARMLMIVLFVLNMFVGGMLQPTYAAGADTAGTIEVVGGEAASGLLPETAVTYVDKESALDVLIKTVGQSNIVIEDTKYGKSITTINGLEKKDPFYWAFYVNGIFSQKNYDAYTVQNGDKLSFVYQDWSKPAQKAAMIKVLGKEGKELIKPLSDVAFIGEPNAFQFLQVAVGHENVTYEQYDFGKMVSSINGVKAAGTDFWGFYVNGKMASVGPDGYKLQAGDQISFKLESSAPPADGSNGGENQISKPLSAEAVKKSVDKAANYVGGNQIGEWEAIALKQAGKTIPATYLENVRKLVKDRNGRFSKITDYERYVLGVLAAGGNPTNVEGHNLLKFIYDGDVTKQGLNGVAYGLIALDSANFEIPATATWTKEKLLNKLLAKQNKDGGWSWDGSTTSDLDTTGMVLTALAPHKGTAGVQSKIEKAVQFLSENYIASKIDNSSTASQAVIALSALTIDANEKRFTKEDGTSLIEYLLTFQNADGGFDWQGGDKSDAFSTQQGIQAVVAYQLKAAGKGALYQLPLSPVKNETKPVPVPNKQMDKEAEQTGHRLPDTATNSYNLIAFGFLLILLAGVFYTYGKRKRT